MKSKETIIQTTAMVSLLGLMRTSVIILLQGRPGGQFMHVLICGAYLLCPLIRLAWFNSV